MYAHNKLPIYQDDVPLYKRGSGLSDAIRCCPVGQSFEWDTSSGSAWSTSKGLHIKISVSKQKSGLLRIWRLE